MDSLTLALATGVKLKSTTQMNDRDPYKSQREEEYAQYNRVAIRMMPFFVILWFIVGDLEGRAIGRSGIIDDVWLSLLVVFIFHVIIELLYSYLKKDSIFFSSVVFFVWLWCIYQWWFVVGGSILFAFLPPLGLLIIVLNVCNWYQFYKEIKQKQI